MTKTDLYTGIIKIKLPTETVIVGPGTVPTSAASTSRTSVQEMATGLRKASKSGLFDGFVEDGSSAGTAR